MDFSNDGVTGFYRGIVANLMRTTGGAFIITLYYEFAKHF